VAEQVATLIEKRSNVPNNRAKQGVIMVIFCPYPMLKDHRTGEETSNVQKILDGDLKMFSDSYLLWQNQGSPSIK